MAFAGPTPPVPILLNSRCHLSDNGSKVMVMVVEMTIARVDILPDGSKKAKGGVGLVRVEKKKKTFSDIFEATEPSSRNSSRPSEAQVKTTPGGAL